MAADNPILILSDDFGDRDIWEMEARSCWCDVLVETPDGRRFRMNVFHPFRILQQVESIRLNNGNVFFESNLVVLDAINLNKVQEAIDDLWRRGEFKLMLPWSE